MSTKRLFGILYYLSHAKNATTSELASQFQVSTRTINRDINKLSEMDIPLYTEMGRNGGVFLLDSFILDRVLLTQEEQNHLMLLLKGTKKFNPVVGNNILDKLKSIFSQDLIDWLEVDISPWYSNTSTTSIFEFIKKSIINKEQIEFKYFGTKNTQLRICNPHKLLFKSQAWYLQAYCFKKKEFRCFKLNRMSTPRITGNKFVPLLIPKVSTIKHTIPPVNVVLEFSSKISHLVYDEFPHGDISIVNEDSIVVKTKLPEENWVIRYLMSFGSNLKDVAPSYFKKGIIRELENTRENLLN